MTNPDKAKSTVTPIKKAAEHQKEDGAEITELEDRRLKAYDAVFNGREEVIHLDEDSGEVIIDGKAYNVDLEQDPDGYYIANVEQNHKYKIEYQRGEIYLEGRLIEFTFNPAVPKLERKKGIKSGLNVITAPLPGNVTKINVSVGDEVSVGETVLTLEAMKMQNDIVSDSPGIVEEILVTNGDLVSGEQKLIVINSEALEEEE